MDSNSHEKTPSNEPVDNNAPVFLPPDEGNQQEPGFTVAKSDRTLWLTIGGITVTACCVVFLVLYTFMRAFTQQIYSFQPPTMAPTVLPNLTATQRAWVRPSKAPTLGTAEEARDAVEADVLSYVESFSYNRPYMPEVNQPGDIYVHDVALIKNEKLLWDYGWCATTPEIREENFGKMKIVFNVNGEPIPQRYFAITESQRSDGGHCRTYTVLFTNWTEGQHQLEIRVTFTQPTHDGWNLYPAGLHTFLYFVTVNFP